MNPWRWVDPRVQSVRVSDLGAYLRHKGWRLKPNPNPNLLRFEETTVRKGRPFYQMIPASEESDDYRQRVSELITTLSELEDRHPIAVLNDILRCGSESAQGNGADSREDAEAVRPRSRKRKPLKGTTPP